MSYTSTVLANTETPMTLARLCRLDGKYRAIEISPGFVVVDITRHSTVVRGQHGRVYMTRHINPQLQMLEHCQ